MPQDSFRPTLNKLADIDPSRIDQAIQGEGLTVRIGPFWIQVRSPFPSVCQNFRLLYANYPVDFDVRFADLHVAVMPGAGIHRFYRRQALFLKDDAETPFKPLPVDQAYAMYEWGLNWAIASQSHQYLIIHAAVIERNGNVAILPGVPGAGKSTLCAALIHRGWRLFSDEMALIDLKTLQIHPIPRPVGLKNQSISIIQSFAPEAIFGTTAKDTHKGTVSHLKPPDLSVDAAATPATAKWIIFPKYLADSATELTDFPKSRAFMEVIQHAFNYHILGEEAFVTLCKLLDKVETYQFTYSDLREAVDSFSLLA